MLAIYNKHWTSPVWKQIKKYYNLSPGLVKKLILYFFSAVQFAGAWITMGEKPTNKSRGMDFWFDQMDWLGGYPYEYATSDEIIHFFQYRGFTLLKIIPQKGWTGNIEYIFRKNFNV